MADKSSENEKSEASKKENENNNPHNYPGRKMFINSNTLITNKNFIKNTFETYKFNRDNESIVLTGEFIPEFSYHFTLNINNLSFIKIKEKNNNQFNYL